MMVSVVVKVQKFCRKCSKLALFRIAKPLSLSLSLSKAGEQGAINNKKKKKNGVFLCQINVMDHYFASTLPVP